MTDAPFSGTRRGRPPAVNGQGSPDLPSALQSLLALSPRALATFRPQTVADALAVELVNTALVGKKPDEKLRAVQSLLRELRPPDGGDGNGAIPRPAPLDTSPAAVAAARETMLKMCPRYRVWPELLAAGAAPDDPRWDTGDGGVLLDAPEPEDEPQQEEQENGKAESENLLAVPAHCRVRPARVRRR